MSIFSALFFILSILACGEKETDTATETDTEPNTETDSCATISVEDCNNVDGCVTIAASPVIWSDEQECVLWANTVDEVGCIAVDSACDTAITYAAQANDADNCYGFTNTCIPSGWGECRLPGSNECPD